MSDWIPTSQKYTNKWATSACFLHGLGALKVGESHFAPLCPLAISTWLVQREPMLEDLLSPMELQKANKGVSPAWEPPIEWGVTPVSAREITILGVSEPK